MFAILICLLVLDIDLTTRECSCLITDACIWFYVISIIKVPLLAHLVRVWHSFKSNSVFGVEGVFPIECW